MLLTWNGSFGVVPWTSGLTDVKHDIDKLLALLQQTPDVLKLWNDFQQFCRDNGEAMPALGLACGSLELCLDTLRHDDILRLHLHWGIAGKDVYDEEASGFVSKDALLALLFKNYKPNLSYHGNRRNRHRAGVVGSLMYYCQMPKKGK